jgi:hypothetical protein
MSFSPLFIESAVDLPVMNRTFFAIPILSLLLAVTEHTHSVLKEPEDSHSEKLTVYCRFTRSS